MKDKALDVFIEALAFIKDVVVEWFKGLWFALKCSLGVAAFWGFSVGIFIGENSVEKTVAIVVIALGPLAFAYWADVVKLGKAHLEESESFCLNRKE